MSEITSTNNNTEAGDTNDPPHPTSTRRVAFPSLMCHSESVLPEAPGLVCSSMPYSTMASFRKSPSPVLLPSTASVASSTSPLVFSEASPSSPTPANITDQNIKNVVVVARPHGNSFGPANAALARRPNTAITGTHAGNTNGACSRRSPIAQGSSVPFSATLTRTVSSLSTKSIEKLRTTPKNLSNKFLVGNLIGRGSYAKVRDAYDVQHKTVVAIKIFNWAQLKRVPGGDVSLKRELSALRKVTRHPNCVSLVEFWRDSSQGKSYVALDYMPCGTLQGLLLKAGENPLPLEQARLLFSGLISGLIHMHECGVYHRDIKPDNLMLLNNTTLCISDFGTSTSDSSTEGIGAPGFQPPEVASNGKAPYADKLDVWSAGITLYIMVTGKYPFPVNMSLFQTFKIISSTDVSIPDDLPGPLQDVLRGMLTRDPEARFSCQQVAESAWLTTPDEGADTRTFISVQPRSTIFTEQRIPRFIHDLVPGAEDSVQPNSVSQQAATVSPSNGESSSTNAAQQSADQQKTDQSNAPNSTRGTSSKKGCAIQ